MQRPAIAVAFGALALVGASYAATHRGYGVGYRYRTYRLVETEASYSAERAFMVREYAPPSEKAVPAVVLLHGYMADAAMLERLWAEELVQRGMFVTIIERVADYAERTSGPSLEPGVRATLALVGRLRNDARVDADRIALVGHSYGAAMAIKAACLDWRIAATVALASSLQPIEYINHVCPRNLLILNGSDDRFNSDSQQRMLVAKATRGNGDLAGEPYGDMASGNARLYLSVPNAGHVAILTSLEARRDTIAWLERALFGSPTNRPVREFPQLWLGVGVLSTILLVESLTAAAPSKLVDKASPSQRSYGSLPRVPYAAFGVVCMPLIATWSAPLVQHTLERLVTTPFVGGEIFLGTILTTSIAALPLALLWRPDTQPFALNCRSSLTAIMRVLLLYAGLRILLAGYYDPTPVWSDIRLLVVSFPLLVVALTVLTFCASALDHGIATWNGTILKQFKVPRLVFAGALGKFMWTYSGRFNNVSSPGIFVVPFGAAVVVSIVTVLIRRRNDSLWSSALYGALLGSLVMAAVFPLK